MPKIPPFQYSFTDADIEFVTSEVEALLRTKSLLTMGAHGQSFENQFRALHGTRHAIAVASGTAALEIILQGLGVQGGEVIVPTNTFGATAVAVLRAGATPVFADCAEDLSINPQDVRRKISKNVRAVITVHIGGLISPYTLEVKEVCDRNGIPLVEDAAHATGSSLEGVKAGGFGVAAAFSFFSTKILTCGEGGMIATDDVKVQETALLLRDHAKDTDGNMATLGYNWRLTELQAILGIAQLRRLDEIVSRRNEIAQIYDQVLCDLSSIEICRPPASVVHNRYKYIVFLKRHEPAWVRETLERHHGVTLGGYVYATPCHQQAAFAPYAGGEYPIAERLCSSHICPPIYPDMPHEDARYAAESLRAVLET